MSILDWLGLGRGSGEAGTGELPESASTTTIRRIVAELDSLEPERARKTAAFAYILGRVAHADLDVSEEETAEMERIVREIGGLPEDQAVIVVQMAKTHNQLFGGTEDYLVTREYDRTADRDEKLALLDCLFAVSASDSSISSHEDTEIRKIADELHLSREDFLGARSRYRDYLEVLRRKEEEGGA